MKKILLLILIIIIGSGFYFTNSALAKQKFEQFFYQSACQNPLAVKIGTIDPNYNLTQTQVKDDINQAIQIWNKGYGQELLVYDPNGLIPINFVYDQRQKLITQTQTSTKQVSDLTNNLKQQQASLLQQKSTLDPQFLQLQNDTNNFNQQMAQYNQEVSNWNSSGGGSPQQYQKLKDQQAQLKATADSLSQRSAQLQSLAQSYNANLDQLKQQAGQLKTQATQLGQISQNLDTAISQQPEEGEYIYDQTGQKIDIFFLVNQQDLVHTLAHEMGHALGLDHNSDPKSIMYPYSNSIIIPSKEDLSDLKNICRQKNIFELEEEKLITVFDYYKSLISTASL